MATGNGLAAGRSQRAAGSGVSGDTGAVIVSVTAGEPILRQAGREISILVAREDVTVTHARYAAGQQVAGPHVHHRHTDAFYVLEGELALEVGREAETVRIGAGGLVAAPPEVAHAFRTIGDGPARWLTIHAQDGGFAAFMRSMRDGGRVEWDIAPVPADGGLSASEALISSEVDGEHLEFGDQRCRLICALPDLCVVEWHTRGSRPKLPLPDHDRRADSFFLVDGELLSLHTPDSGLADYLRRVSGREAPESRWPPPTPS
jgi:mannose-6-phosphate isomerase-like protein (cupin superfamily)